MDYLDLMDNENEYNELENLSKELFSIYQKYNETKDIDVKVYCNEIDDLIKAIQLEIASK